MQKLRYREQAEHQRTMGRAKTAARRARIPKERCSICGGSDYVEGHHHDYSQPLTIEFLCRKHHRLRHEGHD